MGAILKLQINGVEVSVDNSYLTLSGGEHVTLPTQLQSSTPFPLLFHFYNEGDASIGLTFFSADNSEHLPVFTPEEFDQYTGWTVTAGGSVDLTAYFKLDSWGPGQVGTMQVGDDGAFDDTQLYTLTMDVTQVGLHVRCIRRVLRTVRSYLGRNPIRRIINSTETFTFEEIKGTKVRLADSNLIELWVSLRDYRVYFVPVEE